MEIYPIIFIDSLNFFVCYVSRRVCQLVLIL